MRLNKDYKKGPAGDGSWWPHRHRSAARRRSDSTQTQLWLALLNKRRDIFNQVWLVLAGQEPRQTGVGQLELPWGVITG